MENRARRLDAMSRSLQAASAAASREAEAGCRVGQTARVRRGAPALVGLLPRDSPPLLCSPCQLQPGDGLASPPTSNPSALRGVRFCCPCLHGPASGSCSQAARPAFELGEREGLCWRSHPTVLSSPCQ